jgi:phytoene synthase
MTTHAGRWEDQLLQKALPLNSRRPAHTACFDAAALANGYQQAAELTRQNSRTFHLTSSLLPPDKRRAARALYAFCRVADDIVDEGGSDTLGKLDEWRRRTLGTEAHPGDPVPFAWAHTREQYRIPRRYAEQLLDGVALDLTKIRYADFTELAHYCYGVASTVGLMTMHITGFASEAAIPYAVKLGVALQLTNILRDVGEDWQRGRLYLPQNELAAYGLSEADIAAGRLDKRWRGFMRYQIRRARRLYREALPGIALLHPHGRLAIAASADLYQAIIMDIEDHGYDVFNRRAHLTGWEKIKRLPGIWWLAKTI